MCGDAYRRIIFVRKLLEDITSLKCGYVFVVIIIIKRSQDSDNQSHEDGSRTICRHFMSMRRADKAHDIGIT